MPRDFQEKVRNTRIMTEKMVSTEEYWTEVISPYRGWFDLHLDELWRYRDLIKVFVHRDFVTNYNKPF